jgi:hypothetical protein
LLGLHGEIENPSILGLLQDDADGVSEALVCSLKEGRPEETPSHHGPSASSILRETRTRPGTEALDYPGHGMKILFICLVLLVVYFRQRQQSEKLDQILSQVRKVADQTADEDSYYPLDIKLKEKKDGQRN